MLMSNTKNQASFGVGRVHRNARTYALAIIGISSQARPLLLVVHCEKDLFRQFRIERGQTYLSQAINPNPNRSVSQNETSTSRHHSINAHNGLRSSYPSVVQHLSSVPRRSPWTQLPRTYLLRVVKNAGLKTLDTDRSTFRPSRLKALMPEIPRRCADALWRSG